MKSSGLPAVATWLLNHLTDAPQNDSLTGDLTEEYARGRSRTWYWKQVLAAILVGFWTEISAHKLLALRALAIGWTVLYLDGLYPRLLSPILFRLWWPFAHKSPLVFQFGSMLLWIPFFVMTGWLVGRLHRPHHAAMVLLFTASVGIWGLQGLPFTYSLLLDSFSDTRYLPYLVVGTLYSWILEPMSILLGGLLSAPRRNDRPQEQRVAT